MFQKRVRFDDKENTSELLKCVKEHLGHTTESPKLECNRKESERKEKENLLFLLFVLLRFVISETNEGMRETHGEEELRARMTGIGPVAYRIL